MRVFKEPNLHNNWKCPICKTATKKEVILIGIDGTYEDHMIEAEQFHLDCLELLYDKKMQMIYQRTN